MITILYYICITTNVVLLLHLFSVHAVLFLASIIVYNRQIVTFTYKYFYLKLKSFPFNFS